MLNDSSDVLKPPPSHPEGKGGLISPPPRPGARWPCSAPFSPSAAFGNFPDSVSFPSFCSLNLRVLAPVLKPPPPGAPQVPQVAVPSGGPRPRFSPPEPSAHQSAIHPGKQTVARWEEPPSSHPLPKLGCARRRRSRKDQVFSHPHTGMQLPSPQNVQLVQGGWGAQSWVLLGVLRGLPPSQHTHPEVWLQDGIHSRALGGPTASGAREHREGGTPTAPDKQNPRHSQAHRTPKRPRTE